MARQSVTRRAARNQARARAAQQTVTAATLLGEWLYLDLARRARVNTHARDCARCAIATTGSGTLSPCRDGAELGRLAAESTRYVLELRERIADAAVVSRDNEPGRDLATLF